MHYSVKNALIFALVYISFEIGLILASLQYSDQSSFFSYAASSCALMIAIALTNYASAKENVGKSFINDIKNGIKTSGIYAVVVAAFLVLYHTTIVPDYADVRVELIRESAMNTPLSVIQENNPGALKEDFVAQQLDQARFWLNPKKIFPIALLGIMLVGMVYSFVFTALFRKVLFRR